MKAVITLIVIVVAGVICALLPDNEHRDNDKADDEDDFDPHGWW